MRVYLDSCVVIYLIEGIAPWYGRLVTALNSGERFEFVVTGLVRMECLVKPLRENDTAVRRELETYFASIEVLPVTTVVFDRAAELRAHHNLRTPDAIHLAAAMTHGCDEFWTNDNRLAQAAPSLTIRQFGG